MAEQLHPIEIKVLENITRDKISVDNIVKKNKTDQGQVRKALAWLEEKKLVDVEEHKKQIVTLGANGIKDFSKGLPEKRFLKIIENSKQPLTVIRSKLEAGEFNNAIGFLRKQGFITVIDNEASITSLGRDFLHSRTDEEKIIEMLSKKEYDYLTLPKELQEAVEKLNERKDLIQTKNYVERFYSINSRGKTVLNKWKGKKLTEKLTPKMIKEGSWGEFREYNITSPSPVIYAGRKHILREIADRVKEIFIEMGFKEMRSDYVETAFWNFDVMFFPQDHPGREVMDTYYLKNPSRGVIPDKLAKIVKKVQEDGGNTGSKGHKIEWSEDIAKSLILRAHTTQTSFRYLAKGLTPPYKFFSVDKVFRNETLDATHLNEFHQIEGFVAGERLTLRNLCGMFSEFYKKMGVEKIKFKPTYNPYTEPSMEIFGYIEKEKRWIEVGNSGIFRPETLLPLGIEVPVIAWGLALERLIPFQYKINDIRQAVGHFVDIDTLRNSKIIRGLV